MLEKKKRRKSKGAVNDLANLVEHLTQLVNTVLPIMDRLQMPPYNVPPPSEPPPMRLSAWDIFGLSESCSEDEFKKRYIDLLKFYHPDSGGSTEMMKRVNQAADRIKEKKGWR